MDDLRQRLIESATRNTNGRYTQDEVADLVRRMIDGEPDALSLLLSWKECTAPISPEIQAVIDQLESRRD